MKKNQKAKKTGLSPMENVAKTNPELLLTAMLACPMFKTICRSIAGIPDRAFEAIEAIAVPGEDDEVQAMTAAIKEARDKIRRIVGGE